MVSQAQADQQLSAFRFADVLGPAFAKENLPYSAAFFAKVVNTANGIVANAKSVWHRPRPYEFDKRVSPCVARPNDTSYPSGHATVGYLLAIVLSQIVPEKRAQLFARAEEFAINRVVGGVHYRSDIEAGRLCGTLIAEEIFRQPGFLRDLSDARNEVRLVLGYQAKNL
jgi:acid phosphatase (class A)